MAYTTQADIELVAGTAVAFNDLADIDGDGQPDAAVLAMAQAEADSWIDGYARRLYGTLLPFGGGVIANVAPAIRALAAAETLYRLKAYKRLQTPEDTELRREREATLQALEAGRWNPVSNDPYPIRDGGGTPTVRVRSIDDTDGATRPSRDGMKGFW